MKAHRVALVKTRPDRLAALHRALSRHPGAVVVACGDYVSWRLKQSDIPSIRLESFSSMRGIESVHRDLDRQFSTLVSVSSSRFPWLKADLLKNHFTWKIQAAYQLAVALVSLARKARVSRIYFEPSLLMPGRRLAPSVASLVVRAVRAEGIGCETF